MKTSGQAGLDVNVIDVSAILATGLKGVTGYVGVTERGPVDTVLSVSSWEDYQVKFGGLISESAFPEICKRALDAGARLKIVRAAAHTNVLTPNSVIGTKGTLAKATAAVAETRATATKTITATGTAGDTVAIRVLVNGVPVLLGMATIPATPTTTTAAAAYVSAINANTAVTGFSASNAVAVVTVTAPVGSGAGANAYAWNDVISGATASTDSAFTGGVTAVSAVALSFEAVSVGTWANSKLWSKSVAAKSGTAGAYDITFGIDGSIAPDVTIFDVVATPTSNQLISYNALITNYAKVLSITTLGTYGKSYFTGGAENKALISEIDHVGDSATATGMHAFDSDTEITKLAIPAIALPVVDRILADYADARKDIRVLLRTPTGVSGDLAIAYRRGTSPYSHTPINSWRASMFTGTLLVADPVTLVEKQFSELGNVTALYSNKDNKSVAWFSAAGSKRGVLSNVNGVLNNLYSPALRNTADAVSVAGINAIVNHPTFGVVLWDNVTLWKQDTLLKFDNVAELLVYLTRAVAPIAESETFEPNDIETWKTICRKIKPLLETVKTGRGVWDYLIQGDQDIDDISQAVVNKPETIDVGAYTCRIFIQPKVGLKFIGIDMIVTNSGVSFEEISQTL